LLLHLAERLGVHWRQVYPFGRWSQILTRSTRALFLQT
jgi:hypothetical protein